MKIIIAIILLFLCCHALQAQTAAEQLSEKIAQRIKDTLQVVDSIKTKIYNINIQLHQEKSIVRTQYTGTDSLRIKIQQVENKRDSLYQTVLPNDKYNLYLTKKKNLVNNN